MCIKDSGSDRRGKEGGEEGGVEGGTGNFGKGYFERKPTPINGKRKTLSRAIIQSRWEGRTEEENGIGGVESFVTRKNKYAIIARNTRARLFVHARACTKNKFRVCEKITI